MNLGMPISAICCAFALMFASPAVLGQDGGEPNSETLPVLQAPDTETSLEPVATSPQELLTQGNALYQQESYEEAARAFQTALAYGIENEILHYNLGNALFRLGHLGPAILEYERALLFSPANVDIRTNLEFVRSHATDVPGSVEEGPAALVRRWLLQPGINGSAFAALIAYLIGAILLTGSFFASRSRPAMLRTMAVVALLLAVPPALVVATQGSARELDNRAVVMAERVECRSGPGQANPVLFAVHEGTTVELVDEQNGWSRVTLPDGLNGWLPQEVVERVRLKI